MVIEKNTFSANPLEQFIILGKSLKGAACLELINQVLEAPGIFVFGELLDMPNMKEIEKSPNKKYWDTLNLFAYGTYTDYLKDRNNYLQLTPSQTKKLQHLTIVTLATKSKCIPYINLLKELDIKNVRDLEDLIIEAVYADIIHGKLDQKNSQLEVDSAIGRDIRSDDIDVIVSCLEDWCAACEGVLTCVESQIHRANSEKNKNVIRKADVEQEINNIKKTLKTQLQERAEGAEEAMVTDSREPSSSGEKGKKPSKVKGIRSGGKFWLKS